MAFKDLKKGYTVPALDKQTVEVKKGSILEISLPRMHMDGTPSALARMVVDVTIDIDGKIATYIIPEDACVTYPKNDNIVIATDQSYIIQELEAMYNSSKQVVDSIDKHKEIMEKTSKLLLDLNPQMKAQKETDDRITQLENAILNIQEGMSKITSKLNN